MLMGSDKQLINQSLNVREEKMRLLVRNIPTGSYRQSVFDVRDSYFYRNVVLSWAMEGKFSVQVNKSPKNQECPVNWL